MNDVNLTAVAASAVVKLLIMAAAGFAGAKLGYIDEQGSAHMTKALMNIMVPVSMFTSYLKPFDPSQAKGLFIAMGLGLMIHVIGILWSMVFVKKGSENWQPERMAIVYGNLGFMGIPLMSAMFGNDAVFYLSTIILVFNLVFWTHGVMLMTEKTDAKALLKLLRSPSIIAILAGIVFYFARIPVPELIKSPLNAISDSMTPIGMMISGTIIARSDLKACLANKRTYLICFVRLFLVSLSTVPFLKLFGVDPMVALVTYTAAACPVASYVTMFALQYNKNPGYASGLFTVSTIASLLTLPAMVSLYGLF